MIPYLYIKNRISKVIEINIRTVKNNSLKSTHQSFRLFIYKIVFGNYFSLIFLQYL